MECVPMGFRSSKSSVDFTINDVPYTVSGNVPAGTSLNVFIRDYAKLRGTKAMCHEGGCGACIVAVEIRGETMAVNSCLVPVFTCNGWSIKTIEGIGNKKDGYHLMQAALAERNGSQCGYCSPGMVMNLYSLMQDKKLTMKEIENSFGSNICRCTGYRPILETFKGFASDASDKLAKNIEDIEELYKLKLCKKTGQPCTNKCNLGKIEDAGAQNKIDMRLDGANFHKVLAVDEVFEIFQSKPNASYVLNGGNTGHGVYRLKRPDIYIDINDIPDLRRVSKNDKALTLGSNVSLTTAMEAFQKYSKESGFEYLQHLAKHIDLIASVPVRNIGSLGGNLMLKHQYREFPSDVFLIFETAGAQIHILDAKAKTSMTLLEFLEYDMKHKIIYSIVLPALSSEYEFRSYKIMPRAQNAHAHVNAGFLFKLNSAGEVLERPNIIFGAINEHFLHASKTENFLYKKSVFDKKVIQQALEVLHEELVPDHVLPDYSPEFRKTLAEGLFYKFILSIKPEKFDPKLRSGGTLLEREVSSGRHDYDTDKNVWPLTKPVQKLEALYQASGEAQYVNDLPPFLDEVFCAFVVTTVANGKIASVDATQALKMKGVLAFFTAKDIPGNNLFTSSALKEFMLNFDEPLFVDKNILFAGQAIGVIVADTHALANEAAAMVKVTYAEALKRSPVITIKDAIASKDETRFFQTTNQQATTQGNDTKHELKGEFECGFQYHYTMEPQTCVCVPVEDGMDVYPSSQWMDSVQASIAQCLDINMNSINVQIRRLGGGYGAKISRATQIACACALVCYKLHRPTRFIMTIESNMMVVGKRFANRHEYQVGVDDNGRIQYLNSKNWTNAGSDYNECGSMLVLHHMINCYDPSTWSYEGFETRTDLPSNTFCRAPFSTEGIATAETIMEHIARVVGKDPLEVRLANMLDESKKFLQPMIEELSKLADFDMRRKAVKNFNAENRWKKKGIALLPMKYPLVLWGQFNAHVSIYARDGTVSVSHGGIECGQGINTKVAQVAAHYLGIDLKLVTVKPSNSLTAPNNSTTGGSLTSESCAYATMVACKELMERLEPIRKELKNPTWQELVLAASLKDVDLCARHMSKTGDNLQGYDIYGVSIAEVEVDILTGQHVVQRVDIMEDAGISMNPEVDLGQIEGGFVMGMGYWTSEELIYDAKTGQLTNYRTWNYKPPGAKDIPVDFRVYFKRNSPNLMSVLRAKATGEPPFCLSYAVAVAIRHALDSARKDAGNNDDWYPMDGPFTTEKILLNSLTNKQQMQL